MACGGETAAPATAPKGPLPCALAHPKVYKQGTEKPEMGSGGDGLRVSDTAPSHHGLECSELFI